MLAGFALIALVIAVAAGSKPAATAVAICGAGALLIFLPAAGFWLELAGALVLAICGGALATLSSDQLRAFARSTTERRERLRLRQEKAHPKPKPRPRKASGSGKAS